jgi:hypothetical protein
VSDRDTDAESAGKYLALQAFGLIALEAELDSELFRQCIRSFLAGTVFPKADFPLAEEERLRLIRRLAAMAEAGHVAAGRELLALAIATVENPHADVNAALREWLGPVLRRLMANQKGACIETFAPRPAGNGRRPAYSDDLATRLTFEAVQLLGCSLAQAAKVKHQLKASSAFDHAAKRLIEFGLVDLDTGEPYTGAAVRGWFYSSGCKFNSPDSTA